MKTKNYIGEKADLNSALEKQKKTKTIWMIVGGVAALGLIGALIWAFTK